MAVIKFNFRIGYALSEQLKRVADELIIQNDEIKKQYVELNASFSDQEYYQFQEEFNNCDTSIKNISETLSNLAVEMKKYSHELEEDVQRR